MRIAFDYQAFSIQSRGGVSRYIWELSRRISRNNGFDAKVICPWNACEYVDRSQIDMFTFYSGAPKYSLQIRNKVNWMSCLIGYGFAKFDLLHETHHEQTSWYRGNARRVVTAHDMIHELFPASFQGSKASAAKRASISRASHVICVSENTRNDVLRLLDVPASKTSVVYHGVSLSPNEQSPRNAELLLRRPFLLFVGGRGGYKNFDLLLRAYANSSAQSVFSIVCFGGGRINEATRQRLASLNIAPVDLIQVDEQSDSVLAWLYKHAHALIYPSMYEGFGFPPLEAMLQGCPVIAARAGSMPEVLQDTPKWIDPSSESDLRSAIGWIADLPPEDRLRLVSKGKQHAARYSWDTCASETLNVYKQVANA